MRKYIIIFILLILAVVSHAQVQVTASVDSTKILIGGRSHYFITVYAPKGTKISFPEFNNKKEIVPDVEVLSARSDTADANGKVRFRRIYTITAWDAKRYSIPAQKVIVGGEWVPVILIIVLALILVCIAYYLYKTLRRKKHGWMPKKIRVLSFYEQAKHDLFEIAADKMSYKEQKAYYTDVTNVLRKYISQRFNINALEMTSHEILESMNDVCDVSELRVVFNTADLVKFAKYSTDANDMDYYLDSIARFIDSTKVEEPTEVIEESKEETKDTRSHKTSKIAIGLLIVTSVALLLYAASEAYALLM